MATLIRRGRVWYIMFKARRPEGGWKTAARTTGTTDEAEARRMLELFDNARRGRLKREAIRGILDAAGVKLAPEITLAGLWDYYEAHAEASGSPEQVRARRNMVAAFVAWAAEAHPEIESVREVDERLAAEYWRAMAEDGKSPRTRNNIRGQLLVTWRGIQAEAGLPVNPWAVLPRDQGGGESYRMLELDEIRAVFGAAAGFVEPGVEPGFWPWAIAAGIHTGLRLGDLATMEWQEMRPEEGLLVLTPNKTKRWGSDRWAVHLMDAPWVALLPPRPVDAEGHVWPLAAAKVDCRRGLRGFAGICRLAGIETEGQAQGRRKRAVKLVTFHSLRHSFVTHLLRTGRVTEDDLVRQGNWSAVGVVSAVYNSAKWEQARAAAAKVAAAMPELKLG